MGFVNVAFGRSEFDSV